MFATEGSEEVPEEVTRRGDDDNTTLRPKLRVKHILQNMTPKHFTILETATIETAVNHLVKERLSSALALDLDGEISGILEVKV